MGDDGFQQLRQRAFRFAVDGVLFCRTLPRTVEGHRTGDQLFRCGTSVAANYRAAGRSRSPRDFIAKLSTVVEETDESAFWFDLIAATSLRDGPDVTRLRGEAGELLAIFASSLATAKRNQKKRKQEKQREKARAGSVAVR